MKITYANYIGENYVTFFDDCEECLNIVSLKPAKKTTALTLFDSKLTDNEYPIYMELADSDTLEKAIDFCKKYGCLIHSKLTPKNDTEYHNFVNIYNDRLDCMPYPHFCYYQSEMQYLLELYHLLTNETITSATDKAINLTYSVLINCTNLITNEFFCSMVNLEYSQTCDHEKYELYFSKYPVIHYIYNYNYHISLNNIHFPNPKLLELLTTSLKLSDADKLNNDFIINHKQDILSLGKYIFSNVLSFEIQNVSPKIIMEDSDIIADWEYPTLISAIFFCLYVDNSNSRIIARCANPTCNKLFAHSGAYSRKIYCSYECAHKVANRNYKQKISKKTSKAKVPCSF